MPKLMPLEENGPVVGYFFDCPGCKCGHAPYIKPFKNSVGASWSFNGNMEKPTFRPSLLTRIESPYGKVMVCHSFVTDGQIQFLSDCTHDLAGQTVEIPDLD